MADATTAMADGGSRTRAQILDMHRVQIEGQKVVQKLIEKYRLAPGENLLSQLAWHAWPTERPERSPDPRAGPTVVGGRQ